MAAKEVVIDGQTYVLKPPPTSEPFPQGSCLRGEVTPYDLGYVLMQAVALRSRVSISGGPPVIADRFVYDASFGALCLVDSTGHKHRVVSITNLKARG